MSAQPDNKGNLSGGYYSLSDVARLLGIDSVQRIRGWLSGYQRGVEPILLRQYEPIGGVQEASFLDLIEIRFIEHFRRQGVSLQSIRKAALAARKEFRRNHPFAMSNVTFMTDRRRIFLHAAQETGDRTLLDLISGQFVMYEILEQQLARGVSFDPLTGIARLWYPRPAEFPDIVLNPLIANGHPIIEPNRVPTAALFRLWQAENKDYEAVSDWFEVELDQVRQAIEFETALTE